MSQGEGKMKENKIILIECDAEDNGAFPLHKSASNDEICLYVRPAACEREFCGFALLQSDSSGFGYSYGTAVAEPTGRVDELEVNPARLVLDRKGEYVKGYAYKGEYDSSPTEVFLALGAEEVKTFYRYYYQVFPADGTSSEYVRSSYTKFVRK